MKKTKGRQMKIIRINLAKGKREHVEEGAKGKRDKKKRKIRGQQRQKNKKRRK